MRTIIHFRSLFGTESIDLSHLLLPFTIDEVKSAVFSSAPDKAPGPDGLPMFFYQRFWDTLKDDLFDVFTRFYEGPTDLRDINTSWICPIPKKPQVETARDLRPISLMHGVAKIISKALASRLQGVMAELINPFQTAFIKGRNILDNFYTAHVLIHHLHSTKTKAALLKIDFERAFDHIDWKFLFQLLNARGFDTKWTDWMTSLLSTASSTVLLNGVPGSAFASKRGLRQGDPLSPLLFILCIDVLFRMLQAASSDGHFSAVGIGEVRIHTLQFADDVLLFFDGSRKSAAAIKIILDAFSGCSGLRINYSKSALIPIHLAEAQTTDLSTLLGCSAHGFPFTYLGLPLSPKRPLKADYLAIIEKIDARLAGWKGAAMSKGGRLILINSVLSTIPTYFSSTFLLPVWVIKEIDKIRRAFFWKGSKVANGSHCLAKWELLCRSKKAGGIGIRDLRAANASYLMKGLWNFFHSSNLPWVMLLMQKHYRRNSADLLRVPSTSCPVWKGMIRFAEAFLTSVDFILGDGQAIPFWSARWCGDTALRHRFPNLYTSANRRHLSVAKWVQCYGAQQNCGFQNLVGPQACTELQQFSTLVSSVYLSPTLSDSLTWRWTSSGTFTAGSAYQFIVYDGINNAPSKFLWELKAPLTVKLFLWLAMKQKVLTADVLLKRGWIGPSICFLCYSHAESIDHLLLHCTFAKSVWMRLLLGTPIALLQTLSSSQGIANAWHRSRRLLMGGTKKRFDIAFAAACWELWKERNRRIFEERSQDCGKLETIISTTTGLWEYVLAS